MICPNQSHKTPSAMPAAAPRAKLLEQTAGRLRKQDETLRSLGNRVRLRQLLAHWRAEARERARCQFAARVLLGAAATAGSGRRRRRARAVVEGNLLHIC